MLYFYWLIFTICSINMGFLTLWTMFIKILGKFMHNTTDSTVITFTIRDIVPLTDNSSIFLKAGFIEIIVHWKTRHYIWKEVFYRTGTVFFALIPRYGCFMSFRIVLVYWGLKSLSKTFFKISLNGLLSLSKKEREKKRRDLQPCINNFREISFCWFLQ